MTIGVDANVLLLPRWRGIEVYVAELVARMPRLGSDHRFRLYFNTARRRHRRWARRLAHSSAEVRVCAIPGRVVEPLHRRFGLPVDWVAGRVDVMFYGASVSLPQRHGRRVVTVHDLIPVTHPELCDPAHIASFRRLVLPSIRSADAVIVVSSTTRTALREHLRLEHDRVYCVPNGVHETFQPSLDGTLAAATATRYGIDGRYLLYVGTLEARKNVARLVEAFGRSAVAADHTLVLAGTRGWGAAEASAGIASLPRGARVRIVGYVAAEDLPALYRGATAFVFPSCVEGFGIPVLEAMASGCPVLTSTAPALTEVAADAALVVDPLDTDAIADGIRRLVHDAELRETLRVRGLRRAKEFSWDRTAAETLAVLERVAAA